ncbi:MAG: FIST C-terminal domain-containing protein [Candidatus Lindowbacteria bacterium]|nr:FIST C-terminal domain-containing protein [Candidatus Lindowbacteria bacterium]
MKWASSLSTDKELSACVEKAAASILSKLGPEEIDLLTVFISPHFAESYHNLHALLEEHLPHQVLLGCSAEGIVGGGKEWEHKPGISVTAASLPDVEILSFHSPTTDLPDLDSSPRVWHDWLDLNPDAVNCFILLGDPFSFDADSVLSGLDFAYPHAAKIGGLASGAGQPGGNRLYVDGGMEDKGMALLALGGNIEVDTIVAQGCRPIGKSLCITKCQGNLLQAIDGQPPLAYLQKLAEELTDYDRPLINTSLFLGIQISDTNPGDRSTEFLIRNLMGLSHETGGIAIGATLQEGQTVQFHLRDKQMSAKDLSVHLDRYAEDNNSKSAAGALLFSCLGRGEYLYGEPDHDTGLFHDKLGAIPLGGFFCNGEIGPVGDKTFIHGYTSSFGIFREKG